MFKNFVPEKKIHTIKNESVYFSKPRFAIIKQNWLE